MQIIQEKIDEQNVIVKINVTADDYEPKVQTELKNLRKKVVVDGFRPGNVPMGIINKMYGKAVLLDEINKTVSEALQNYIEKNNLNILGEPLPLQLDEKINFDTQKDFLFSFELGLSPEFSVDLSILNKLVYHEIEVDNAIVEEYTKRMAEQYGSNVPAETIVENEIFWGNLKQLDESGNILENGISSEKVILTLKTFQDDINKQLFIGKKVGDSVDFNPRKTISNGTELKALFKITTDDLPKTDTLFRFTITEIKLFKPSEINQELFTKVCGLNEDGTPKVNNLDDFKAYLKELAIRDYTRMVEMLLSKDIKNTLLNEIVFSLPVNFLKKWILHNNNITQEQLENEFPKFEKQFKWQLIKSRIVKDLNIELNENEYLDFLFNILYNQYYQYGFSNVPTSIIKSSIQKILENKEENNRMQNECIESKMLQQIIKTSNFVRKKISKEEFFKNLETNQEQTN